MAKNQSIAVKSTLTLSVITTDTALPPPSMAWHDGRMLLSLYSIEKMLFNFNVFRWSITCVKPNQIGTRTILLDAISIYFVSPINYLSRFIKIRPFEILHQLAELIEWRPPKKHQMQKVFSFSTKWIKRIWQKMWREYTINGTPASSPLYLWVCWINLLRFVARFAFFCSRFKFLLPHFSFVFEHGKWNACTHARTLMCGPIVGCIGISLSLLFLFSVHSSSSTSL